jgi:hypothetical protein
VGADEEILPRTSFVIEVSYTVMVTHSHISCLWLLHIWASAELMHNLLKMMVIPDSAGDAS